MRKDLYKKGITVIEMVVSIAIFAIISTVAFQSYITVNRLTESSDKKDKAIWLAEEGIEAARSLRDNTFASISASSTKGIFIGATSTWQLSATSTTDTVDGYVRSLSFSAAGADTMTVTSKVDWLDRGATSTFSVTTNLTNWKKIISQAAGLTINTAGANLSAASSSRLLTGITLNAEATSSTTTITQVRTTWTTSNRRLQIIYSPNDFNVFGPVSQVSGATSTLTTPIILTPGQTKTFQLYFNSTMANNTITITFTMSDGTNKTVIITNPPTGT